MINYKEEVIKKIKEVFPELIENSISIPPKEEMGDFSIPCQPYSKQFGSVQGAVEKIYEKIKNLQDSDSLIANVQLIPPYVNIFLNKELFIKDILEEINKEKDNFASENNLDKTIVIDYSSPNVAKNMGIHNLRSTIIGQALCNLYKHLGYKVVGINHLGDWGTQFGKLIWALEKWSCFEELEEKGILFLNDMYVKYHEFVDKQESEVKEKIHKEAQEWSKKIELNDVIAKKWWEIFVEVSMDEYNKVYQRLNINFDDIKGESFYIQFLEDTIKKLESKNLTLISDGALVVSFDEKEKMPPCLLKRSDGATLYGTRDITAILYRIENYNPVKILYVVDISQQLHFQQVFKVMEMYDESNKEKLEHIIFGRLSFPDISMSTRKGNIVPVKEVLDKAQEKILEIINEKNPTLENKEETSQIVGDGAIIFGDLINDRLHDVVFEWDKVLDFHGETAPYVQYTHARIKSILRKENSKEFNSKHLTNDLEYSLVKKMYNLNEVLKNCAKQNKPSILAKYIVELCQLFNSYYVKVPILKEENIDVKNSRLFLISQVAQVIKTSMSILNIKVPEEM